MSTQPMAQPQGRLVIVIDIGGTTARQAIADDLVRRLNAHPLYRVLKTEWKDDHKDGPTGDKRG